MPTPTSGRGARALALRLVVPGLAMLLAACAGIDAWQEQICRDVIPALDRDAGTLEMLPAERDPGHPHGVVVRYRRGGGQSPEPVRWIRCRFAAGGFSPGRGELVEVATDRRGRLSPVELFMLRRFWLGRFESQAATRAPAAARSGSAVDAVAYGLQQAANALVAGCIYGLLASAYTLVFAIVSRINMAFGEFAMLGAYAAVLAVHGTAALIADAFFAAGVVPTVLVAIVAAAAMAALLSWTTERVIFRPLSRGASQPVLIATVGLAILLQEAVRLSQGARERWLQPVLNEPFVLAGGSFAVTITTAKIAIVGLTAVLFACLLQAVRLGRWGRAWRACADDAQMAALCGIDVGRTVALTFAVSGASAGIAGAVIALHYGGVGFTMGTVLGFKALSAAVIGGIGSLPGAMAGGFLIAAIETIWSAYLPVAGRDLAAFGLLALVLVFRPSGLFALTRPRSAGSDRRT